MVRKILTVACAATIALIAPKTASAASLSINDATAPDGSIIFSVGQFDAGVGFVLDNTTLMTAGLGTANATVSEGTTGLITHTFTGQFFTSGALVMPTFGTINFNEAGSATSGTSDMLTFSYSGGGAGGIATLSGSFVSATDLIPLIPPQGATFVPEGIPFFFSNTNITASAVSDVDSSVVPLPAALPLFASGLVGLGLLGWRRKRKAAA
jgi:hypothetical protein